MLKMMGKKILTVFYAEILRLSKPVVCLLSPETIRLSRHAADNKYFKQNLQFASRQFTCYIKPYILPIIKRRITIFFVYFSHDWFLRANITFIFLSIFLDASY